MDEANLRAWWWHKQGLDGRLAGKPAAEVLEKAGWARSVGGAGPYLTLYSRAGIGRETADAAVAALRIHELPAARGCTYVVPAADFALALRAGHGFGQEADMKNARKLGVTDGEIDRLTGLVLKSLALGPLDPDQIRETAGDAVRSLGAEGKKKGLTTTLPLALGSLQAAGAIRRVPTNGRLDQQRYRYALWKPNPLEKSGLSAEECYTELARRYFKWIGPATLAEFQWFSGLGVKAAKDAVAPLKLAAVEGGRLMFPEDLDAFQSFQAPREPQYALVSSLDSLALLRRDLESLIDAADHGRKVFVDKDARPVGGLSDLPSHGIFDRGRLVGLWEFDTATESIAWMTFGVRDQALEEAVKRTEAYVRDQLGDARSFSLDSPKVRALRVAALRAARKS